MCKLHITVMWYINQQKALAAEGNFWNTSKEWQVVLLTAFTCQVKVAALEKNILGNAFTLAMIEKANNCM